ncbi:Splicing factor 45 [Aphelenchoides besseyi]|nr:Splicing factor 45 [Aphelenchoides besseyi]KAI6210065.1 Splicing factor 45 [Aphelenchoides besseyi]
MSLYDDIDVPSDEEDKEVEKPIEVVPEAKPDAEPNPPPPPSVVLPAGLSFLKTQLESRKAQLQFKVKPTSNLKPSPMVLQNRITTPIVCPSSVLKARRVQPLKIDPSTTFSIIPNAMKKDNIFLFNEVEIEDEYNPTAPTDYATFKPKREAQLAKEQAAREVAERLEKEHEEEERKRRAGAAIAPPSALLEQDSIITEAPVDLPAPSVPKQHVAANIMQKMGYKSGSGLGKDEQGISTALQIQKIGRTSGLIIDKSVANVSEPEISTIGPRVGPCQPFITPKAPKAAEQPRPPVNIVELLKEASRVVLIHNIILPADVNDASRSKIAAEMVRYGQVTNVVVHVMKSSEQAEEEVRTFVEFTNNAQAIKAVIDLNKRFTNGRPISARFYNVKYFEARNYEC